MADKPSARGKSVVSPASTSGKSKTTSSKNSDGGGGPAAQKSIMGGSKRLEKLDDIGGKESLRPVSVRRKADFDEGDYIKVTAPKLSMLNLSMASKTNQSGIENAELDADEIKLKKIRLELKKERESLKKTTFGMRLAIGVCVILAVILIVAIGVLISMATKETPTEAPPEKTTIESTAAEIATTTTTTTTTKKPIKGKTYYQYICSRLPQFANRSRRSCFAESPPTVDSCTSNNGTCWESSFHMLDPLNPITDKGKLYGLFKFLDPITTATTAHNKTASTALDDGDKQLCETCDGKLGICNAERQCDSCGLNQSTITNQAGEWADNCDEPNPCWLRPDMFAWTSYAHKDMVHFRNVCSIGCSTDPVRNAMIYVQHLRCKLGVGGTVTQPCKGHPVRVWKCMDCLYNEGVAARGACNNGSKASIAHGRECAVKCTLMGGADYATYDGVKCKLESDTNEPTGYCYRGQCLPVYKNFNDSLPNEIIMDLGECKKQRDADEADRNW